MECGLMHIKTKNVTFIDPSIFKFLMLCDGRTDFDNFRIVPEEIINNLIDSGVIIHSNGVKKQDIQREYYKRYNNRYIRCLQWSITRKCNLKCKHCYLDAQSSAPNDLPYEDVERVIDQMKECGIYHVKITGGEPLVREDFWNIIHKFVKSDIVIEEIYTNGCLVDENFLKQLITYQCQPIINVSFDGVNHHDWMRGVVGAEKAVNNALRLCAEYGFRTKAEMCLHKANLTCIRDTVLHLAALNVEQLKIGAVFDTDRWNSNGNGSLNIEDYYSACINYLPYYFEDGIPIDISIGNVFQYFRSSGKYRILGDEVIEEKDMKEHYLCKSARNTAYLDPEGTFLPCMVATSLPKKYIQMFPNIHSLSLKTILTKSEYIDFIDMRIEDLMKNNSECNICDNKQHCHGGCRIQAMLEHGGDFFACDTKACEYYKLDVINRVRETIKPYYG